VGGDWCREGKGEEERRQDWRNKRDGAVGRRCCQAWQYTTDVRGAWHVLPGGPERCTSLRRTSLAESPRSTHTADLQCTAATGPHLGS
jgi:hypothetical protein